MKKFIDIVAMFSAVIIGVTVFVIYTLIRIICGTAWTKK